MPTAANLTLWMRRWGALASGVVTGVFIEHEIETTISRLSFLRATYSLDSPDLPQQLVVKTPLIKPEDFDNGGSEVQFYRRLAPAIGGPPVVRCLAAVEEGDSDAGTLVLEDLRATHDHRPWPLPPSRSQSEIAVESLARVHSQWWEAATPGSTVGQPHTMQSLTNMVRGIADNMAGFFDALGDALDPEARRTYERVFSSSLKPWLRLTDPRALTIIHGDAHAWNFLFPRSGVGPAFMIDWQLWHIDVGPRDLAFMIALHWYPRRRRELESTLLRRYYEALLARGVGNYSFDELWTDYRRCVVRNLTLPIIFWSRGMNPEGWWHRLECALAAYRDLECDELL